MTDSQAGDDPGEDRETQTGAPGSGRTTGSPAMATATATADPDGAA
jgi:hypothetical protein